jgi:predicted Zn-dependent protease
MRQPSSGGNSGLYIRLAIGVAIALFSLFSYFASQEFNDVTGENQHISITKEQEIALGQQAAPEMIQEYGGMASDSELQQVIDNIGGDLVANSTAQDEGWQWEFYALDAPDVINAFALPGGQVFITTGLLSRFTSEDQIAGVLAHEITHVLARHSAQQMAQSELTNGLIGAVSVASGDANAAQTAAVIGQLVNMKYGRDDEIQSDTIGVCLMQEAGYEPSAMVEVMEILAEAGGGQQQPEFFSTHPNPQNRIQRIQEQIQTMDCPE